MGRGFGPAPSRGAQQRESGRMRTIRAAVVAATTTAVMCVATTVWATDEVPTETTVATTVPVRDEAPPPRAAATAPSVPGPEPTTVAPLEVTVPTSADEPVTIAVAPVGASDGELRDPAGGPGEPVLADGPGDEGGVAVDGAPVADPSAADGAEARATTNAQVSSTEEAIVTGTQVAQADTGGNVTHEESAPDSGGVAPGGDIDTGQADAVGSRDDNSINQQADVLLTDHATANIVQVALILNIGAALANSGYNMVDSQPAGSSNPTAIGTGDAAATGNDRDQYVTQLAKSAADQQMDDFANQLAVSLWLGVAQSNSGLNVSTGTGVAGSAGDIGSGDATAVGNDSVTAIDQRAAINGSGDSQSNIAQRATVLNLGFAVANSGFNDIAGIAGNLLSAGDEDDDALAQDMFAMLLPALLSANGYGPGSGTIATGDASAIGNRSETYTRQIAHATASGDGIASIVQDILVANVGVAGANTGGNVLGGGYKTLDPQTAETVVKMAAFLASLLSVVHQASFATQLQAQQLGMEIPFGDIIIQVGSVLSGVDASITSPSGARVNLRQVSLVLSLGIARSNTGGNVAITTQSAGDPVAAAPPLLDSTVTSRQALAANTGEAALGVAAALGAVDRQSTGRAIAGNEGVIVICQRIDWADAGDCLAPPQEEPPPPPPAPSETTTTTTVVGSDQAATSPSPTPAPADPASTSTAVVVTPKESGAPPRGFAPAVRGDLPSTGSDLGPSLAIGIVGVLVGLVMLLVGRRPRRDGKASITTRD
jgi:hypothetical protein